MTNNAIGKGRDDLDHSILC